MTLIEGLGALARGARNDQLLHSARLEAGGAVLFGEEMVLAHFRRHPLNLADAKVVTGPLGFAAFTAADALVGDLYQGRVGRLWRLGSGCGEMTEPAVSVAFDPDLAQARGDVFARIEDHPGLELATFEALLETGRGLVAEPGTFRARVWLVRAIAEGGKAAGLFAFHRLGDEPGGRSAVMSYAAVLIDGDSIDVVHDRAGEAAGLAAGWRPRLVA